MTAKTSKSVSVKGAVSSSDNEWQVHSLEQNAHHNAGFDIRTYANNSNIEIVYSEFTQHGFLSGVASYRIRHLPHEVLDAFFIYVDCHHIVAELVQRASDVTAEST
jgi:hypothetical protein